MKCCAIIPAAGKGSRMGGDKALVQLGGKSLLGRIVDDCRQAGIEKLIVVRREVLPEDLAALVETVTVPAGGEMIDSIRAGIAKLPTDAEGIIHFPVDYAMAGADTIALLSAQLTAGAEIVLPIFDQRPGHPIGLARSVLEEALDPSVRSLRDVIGRDRSRVRAVTVQNPWVLRDLDTPEDLRAAAALFC